MNPSNEGPVETNLTKKSLTIPRSIPSHLIPSHPISSHLIPSHPISSHLIPISNPKSHTIPPANPRASGQAPLRTLTSPIRFKRSTTRCSRWKETSGSRCRHAGFERASCLWMDGFLLRARAGSKVGPGGGGQVGKARRCWFFFWGGGEGDGRCQGL